jgi:PAS domain S-box-containing protein
MDAIVSIDDRHRIVLFNPAAERMFGYRTEDLMGQPLDRLIPQRFRPNHAEHIRAFDQTGVTSRKMGALGAISGLRANGEEFPIEASISQVEADGRKFFTVILRDISERKRAEEELREAHVQLQRLLDHSPVVLYNHKLMGEKIVPHMASENLSRLLGFTVEEAFSFDWWLSRLHPDDKDRAIASIQETLANGESRTEYRLQHKDGSFRWVDDQRQVVVSSPGQPSEIIGVWTDITERKQAQERLVASESRYRRLFEAAKDGILILDAETGMVMDVNAFLINLLGFSYEQFLGKAIWDLGFFRDIVANAEKFEELKAKEYLRYENMPLETASGNRIEVEFISNVYLVEKRKVIQCNVRDVTERKRDQAAAARLAAIVQTSDDAIIGKTLEGIVTSWNDGAENIFGFTAEEMVGQPIMRLIPPERVQEERDILAAVHRGESVRNLDTVRRHKDGRLIDVSTTTSAIKDAAGKIIGASKVARDITEQKRASAAVRESEERFRTMADSIPQLAWIAKPDGSIHWYNRRWYEYTGTTPEEMEGWGWQKVHDPAILPRVMEGWTAAIAAGERFEMEFPLRGADGQFRAFLTRVQPLKDSEGRVLQWVGTNTDVDEMKRARAQIQQLNTELEQRVIDRTAQLELANRELELANRHKTEFLSTMSHELRTPLNAIIGFTGTLLMELPGPLLPEQKKQLTTVKRSAHHQLSLINDLLDLAKIESGKVELKLEPIDCGRVLLDIRETLRPMAESKGLRFEMRAAEGIVANTDRRALSQILINLINNAIKFTDRGGIEVDLRQSSGATVFSVTDTGAGIAPEDQVRLFDAFSRIDTESSGREEGTGLGLHVSQKLAALLGGRISFASEPGKGSTFTLTLAPRMP